MTFSFLYLVLQICDSRCADRDVMYCVLALFMTIAKVTTLSFYGLVKD